MTQDLASVTLTESQIEQLQSFLQEQEHIGSLILRPAATLGGDRIEAVLLDAEGEETNAKRILFPTQRRRSPARGPLRRNPRPARGGMFSRGPLGLAHFYRVKGASSCTSWRSRRRSCASSCTSSSTLPLGLDLGLPLARLRMS